MSARQTETYEYDIALSFAGEDRQYVEQVADLLNTRGVRVFFDKFEQASLWGSELQEAFDEIFRTKARFVVAFVSQHYASKPWPTHERRSAQARALIEVGPYFLPVRLDDSELPGLRPTIGYVDGRVTDPQRLVEMIAHKLGRTPTPEIAHSPQRSPRSETEAEQLIHAQPPGWEYLLFAGCLLQGKQRLEGKWRDYELGYVAPGGPNISDNEIPDFLSAKMDEASRLVSNMDRLLSPRPQEMAFGSPSEPGDPTMIQHLAHRVIDIYEGLLDWAAIVRSTAVSGRAARIPAMAAQMVDGPVHQFREFKIDV